MDDQELQNNVVLEDETNGVIVYDCAKRDCSRDEELLFKVLLKKDICYDDRNGYFQRLFPPPTSKDIKDYYLIKVVKGGNKQPHKGQQKKYYDIFLPKKDILNYYRNNNNFNLKEFSKSLISSFGRSGCILYSNEGKINDLEEDFRIEPAFNVDKNGVLRIGKFILKEPTIYMMEKNSVAFPQKSMSFEDIEVLISKEALKKVFLKIIEDAIEKNEKKQ